MSVDFMFGAAEVSQIDKYFFHLLKLINIYNNMLLSITIKNNLTTALTQL